MNPAVHHPPPGLRAVLAEQLRAVGEGLRREVLALLAVFGAVTLLLFVEVVGDGEQIDFEPGGGVLLALLGLLLPFAIWRGERLYAGGYFWTLPVDRPRHALIRILAGGAWLWAATAAFLGWLFVMSLLSGGSIGGEETRLLADGRGGLTPVRWTTQGWEWVALITAGPIAYLLGSAFVLGVKHPVRTAGGLILGFFLLLFLSEEVFPINFLDPVINAAVLGPWGIDSVLTGGAETLSSTSRGPNGEPVETWSGMPSFGRWAGATLLWTALSVAALSAALLRHREG